MKIRVVTMIIIFKNNLLLADIVVIMFSYELVFWESLLTRV